jgi:DNA-directed RNA polymerase subunit RPC12/RpoP
MKHVKFSLMIAAFISLLAVGTVFAQTQTEALTLKLSRDFGYSGFSGDIQGTFSMHVIGPADLVRVVFYIDSTAIGEDTQAPFALQFVTDNYPAGQHEMYAVGYSSNGQEYQSNLITQTFVSAAQGNKATMQIVIPVLVVVFGAILVSVLVPAFLGRKQKNLPPGAPRQYPLGGAICPKCGRPFAVHLWGLRLGIGRFDRCPYCGKWSLVKYASIEKLRAAEQAESEGAKTEIPEMTEEEKLKRDLDNSKYQGS